MLFVAYAAAGIIAAAITFAVARLLLLSGLEVLALTILAANVAVLGLALWVARLPRRGAPVMSTGMKKKHTSVRPWHTPSSVVDGGLAGIAAASLHHVYHAITNQIPDNIAGHVLAELAAGALGGVILYMAFAALCNRLRGTA